MKWIGLTGGLATGKSSVARILRDQGLCVVDADELAHRALQDQSREVAKRFGPTIISPEGVIDRKALGQLVFGRPEHLKWLEHLLHPIVQKEAQRLRALAAKRGDKVAFYDVPLLFEKNLASQFDKVVVVTCSESLQIERMKNRNGWTEQEIQNRLAAQWPLEEKVVGADYVIQNNGSLQELRSAVIKCAGLLSVNPD